ncbi:Guanylate kinase [Rubinisphaera italica]|uniref:Guanylate kinase n=1 Tax=Rubinisphaera italica TaxID=2527969 RepID=A0A5C5X0G1_9PLAN|nr:Guanylate kinase [Rubinisphaera italica]
MDRFVNKSDNSKIGFCVVVISGPSGSGKTTVVSRLEEESPVKLVKTISATTRPPRKHEVAGQDYYFLKPEEFDQRKQNGEFLEFAEVYRTGYWYGTLKSEVERARNSGGWALLEIDVEGALNVMREYPEALTIFLTTPSETVFEQRLRDRGTEDEVVIQKRLETARNELKFASRYRYTVINDRLDRAVEEIKDLFCQHAGECCEHA